MSILANNLRRQIAAQKLCKAFGVRLIASPAIVQIAQQAGYDSLFIDLEHSTLSLTDASQLCTAGLLAGVTPFVRVPYQCGDGFIQRVMDGGAMGIVFPHIQNKDDANAAVKISKYPPWGTRSMTGQLPQFSLQRLPTEKVIQESNATLSVFLMIETKSSIDHIDDIAQVEGVDVLLIGSNDLAIELGVPSQFQSEKFKDALMKVSQACKANGKIMGLAGIYNDSSFHQWAINTLGIGFILAQQDSGVIASGARKCMDELRLLEV